MKEVPVTFGNISAKIFQSLMRTTARTIIITFDRYFSPSIKDYEHSLRDVHKKQPYTIRSKDRTDFFVELKNVYFKQALVEFFIRDWASNHLTAFMNNKVLYLNFDKCYRYESINYEMLVIQVDALSCPLHEEADTKMVFHVCQLTEEANVTIRCSDTDVLIIIR